MPYLDLGATLPIVGAPDNSGFNPTAGGYVITANSQVNLPKVGNYVIWHMVLESALPGCQAVIKWNSTRTFGFCSPASAGSEWWGRCPMRQSDQLFFLFNYGPVQAAVPPQLTLYTEYDPSLPGNS